MSYRRTIPRDLFNEASLLKCLGRIYILLEGGAYNASLHYGGEGDPDEGWNISQNDSTGGLYADNVILMIGNRIAYLERPLNSREPWPLWLERLDDEELDEAIEVFDADGNFSTEMLALIK